VTSTVPALPAGVVVVIWVAETTVNDVGAVDPNRTAVAPPKPVPVIVTGVPPASGPAPGLTPVTVGTGSYENLSKAPVVEVPPGFVTVTSTLPADLAGVVTVIEVDETTVNDVAAVEPKWTAMASVKPVPVIVTGVPPASGPAPGLTPVTVGTGS
jgi:hypothetical protein